MFVVVISREDFLHIPGIDFNTSDPEGLKLNQKKFLWIIRQKEKRVSSSEIARIQGISVRYVNMIWKNYRCDGTRELRKQGRKPLPADSDQIDKILSVREKPPNAGALGIENYLLRDGINIAHNRIHRTLKDAGMAMNDEKKKRQRKWVRYER